MTCGNSGAIIKIMMNREKETIKISVRNLVEFILRSGNLDNRRSFQADKDAMAKGSKYTGKSRNRMELSTGQRFL